MNLTTEHLITSYDLFSKEVADVHFTPGVLTNNFLSKKDLQMSAANKTLYAYRWDGGMLLLQKREDYWKLNFDITDITVPIKLDLPRPCLTEIILRPNDKRLQSAVTFFESIGFEKYIQRQRWERKGNNPVSPGPYDGVVELCKEEDTTAVLNLLYKSFDKYFGCLPTFEEMRDDICIGNVYGAYEAGELVGFLHVRKAEKPYSEKRHLAVSEKMRGRKVAQRLLHQYIKDENAVMRKSWVPSHNTVSQNLHIKNDFTRDGWLAEVLIYR